MFLASLFDAGLDGFVGSHDKHEKQRRRVEREWLMDEAEEMR